MGGRMNLKLYHYWRSSSSWRVRWALEFKEIECEMISVDLLNKESEREPHLSRSPLGFVPVLEVHGHYLTESVAIIEWLEERFPEKKLFPHDDILRAQTRALVELVNAGIQPLQNLIVQEYLTPDP
jgi:maleylacetoacetate isomerase